MPTREAVRWIGAAALAGALSIDAALLPAAAPAAEPVAYLIEIDGPITPVTADFIGHSIERAERGEAACLLIQLDTPGGLYKSTQVIAKEILAARIPIIVYVAPAGARATSAGVFLTYAAHLAVMHPTSTIGAAHPVSLGGGEVDSVMTHKIENDAVAFIRSLAARNGRNADWAEEAVRSSESLTAPEALKRHVVDAVAPDVAALLAAVDGRRVALVEGKGAEKAVVATAGARVERLAKGWRLGVLDAISDPNIAYLLLTLGMLGVLFELYNPGALLPGILGSFSLILAFYGLHTLPINYAGVLLIVLAIILFILEIKVTSYGLLTIGGVGAMLLGSLMLIDIEPGSGADFMRIRLDVIIPTVAFTALFFAFAIAKGIMAQRQQPVTGMAGLVGEVGVARTDLGPGRAGKVLVHGELWAAETAEAIQPGDRVKVLSGTGLRLRVGRDG